jgi:hypothetical protein
MKYVFIIVTFFAFSCKGKSEKKQPAPYPDTTIVATAKPIKPSDADTVNYQRFFNDQFNLSDSFAVETNATVINGRAINIVMARDTTSEFARIVVLKQENGKWNLIDSSGMLTSDGRGPHFLMNGDTLVITHGEHRGYKKLQYIFDLQSGKFKFLQATEYSIDPYKEDKNCSCGLEVYQVYNVKTQRLTVRTELHDYKRFQRLIGSKQKEFARPDKQAWLRDLMDIWAFGSEDIFTIGNKEIEMLSSYKKK